MAHRQHKVWYLSERSVGRVKDMSRISVCFWVNLPSNKYEYDGSSLRANLRFLLDN